jgi:hypothetical protein
MNVRRHRWLPLAAGLLMLTGCTDEPAADAIEPHDETTYVTLSDSDADPDQMNGEPGVYAMTARGQTSAPLAVVDVPEGFSNFGSFAMWPQEVAAETEPYQAIQYWTVHGVHPDPCRHRGGAPEIGGSVVDLAGALETQRVTTMSSVPQRVSLGGYDGLYIQIRIPSTVRFERCGGGYLMVWDGSMNDAQHAWNEPGLDQLWILDVDGVRVVLLASTSPEATEAQAEALEDIITSVRFVEPT